MADSAAMGEAGVRESVEVRVLGTFEVSADGRPVTMSSGRLRVLLAVLAMSAGRAVSIGRLTDAVWDEELPADARGALQVYVTRLRAAFGTDAITSEPAGYVLRTVPDNVDALRFLRLVDRAAQEPAVERALLAEALGLWRGDPFEGLDSVWLHDAEAPRLTEQRLTALERRIDLDLADGRTGEVVGELHDLTSRHPLRESLWSRLLVALARLGRPADALQQYEAVRTRIAEELGADPSAELQRIHADLLAGVAPGSAEMEASRSTAVVPRQLPTDLSTFTGRAEPLERLDDLLIARDPSAGPRVVVLHGTGGVGKTALATRWAHRVVDHFPGGQLYLNLRGYGPAEPMTPAAALDALLRGLGIPGEQIPTEIDARGSLLRSNLAERAVLLVLDNARQADQVRPLLPGSGPSMVVITSRSQLRGLVAREHADRIGVDELDRSESVDLLATVLVSRAVAYERSALVELAQLCGRLPLALAVAAERASLDADTGLANLVADLRAERDRLDVLDLGDESTDLRAVFAWSYRALEVDTARLFRLLGLHPGADIGLPAAAALASLPAGQTRRLLDRLVDVNLLLQRRHGRYELHDLLRVYAADLAESVDAEAEREAALDRMFGWYLHTTVDARTAARLVPGPLIVDVGEPLRNLEPLRFGDHDEATRWFEAERDALLAAVDGAARLDRHRMTFRLAATTWGFFHRRRALDAMLRLSFHGLSAAQAMGDDSAEAHCRNLLGVVYGERMEFEAAVVQLDRALELFDRTGDSRQHARTLDNRGVIAQRMGRVDESVDYLERSIAMSRRVGALEHQMLTVNNLAATYVDLRRFDDAARLAEEVVERSRRSGDLLREAVGLDTLGQARSAEGRYDDAIECYRRSIQLYGVGEDRWYQGVGLTNLGRAHHAAGDVEAARRAWQEALDLFDTLGTPGGIDFSRTMLIELLTSLPPAATTPNT